jgi:YD repeat-containing protein
MRRTLIAAVVLLFLSLSAAAAEKELREQRGFAPNNVYQVGDLDSVNVSNGNVIVRIPIGQEYSVGPTLKYQFVLTYNSKVWDYRYTEPGTEPVKRFPMPERQSNAGLGWTLSLGRLVIVRNTNSHQDEAWTYVAPDGAEFQFHNPTTANDPPILYAFSGQYLRLHRLGSIFRIDFPNGEVHTFSQDGELVEMRDPFGNWVAIGHSADGNVLTVSDGYGPPTSKVRTHSITFASGPSYPDSPNLQKKVASVDLATFAGRALYSFTYAENSNIGYGGAGEPCRKGPLLTSIQLPDGSTYEAGYKSIPEQQCAQFVPSDGWGTINSLLLPTKGKIEWDVDIYDMQQASCGDEVDQFKSPVMGVKERRFRNEENAIVSTWKYFPRLTDTTIQRSGKICGSNDTTMTTDPIAEEFVNIVEAPGGLVTKHYFSAWPTKPPLGEYISPGGFDSDLMNLPVTAHDPASNGRLLSTEVFDCSAGCLTDEYERPNPGQDQLIQRTYLSYARQPLFHEGEPATGFSDGLSPHMVTGQRTETEIGKPGGPYFVDTASTLHDGYGQFAQTVTTTNFPGALTSRTSNIERQRTINNDTWLLNMPSSSSVQEGALLTRTKTEFDLSTGLQKSARTMGNPAVGDQPSDLLTVFCRDSSTAGTRGFITSERYVGGDQAPIPSGDICAIPTPVPGNYFLNHNYTFIGPTLRKHTAQWEGTTFFVTDEEYHGPSGLVETTRDSAEVATTYQYDKLGRITDVRPAESAWSRYSYGLAVAAVLNSSGQPVTDPIRASAHAEILPNGGTSSSDSLRDDHYYYDGLGRLILSKSRMSDDKWSATQTKYDNAGRVASTSMPVESTTADFQTLTPLYETKSTYDVQGRPTTVTAPDGSTTTFVYGGTRVKTRKQTFWNGTDQETETREELDGFGRLVKVIEQSGAGGAEIQTDYGYTHGDHLKSVKINGEVQPRFFAYDLRGLLQSETHPESGTTSYTYDARGHVVSKTAADPNFNLTFEYDSAERPTVISSLNPLRPLKLFTYGTENVGDDRGKGKLWTATRFNYPVGDGLSVRQDEIKVTETYRYPDHGRSTERTTSITSNGTPLTKFTQSTHYNELDLADKVTYPICEGCTAPLLRDFVTTEYSRGRVTEVSDAIGSITYAPDGTWARREHVSGITDVQTPDPHGMPRPQEIKVELPAVCNVIDEQPQDQSILPEGSVTFTVTSIVPATFQWYQGARGDTRNKLVDKTSNVLQIASVPKTTSYWCRVSGPSCQQDSRTATAGTCELIDAEPLDIGIAYGASATLTVTPTDPDDATFQWYQGMKDDDTAPVTGGTSNVLVVSNLNATTSYWCRLTAENGCTQSSRTVTVTVCPPLEIVQPAADAAPTTVEAGTLLTYTVVASGEGLSYAWYRHTGAGNQRTLIGTSPELRITPAPTQPGQPLIITVEVTNGCATRSRVVAVLNVGETLAVCDALLTLPSLYQSIQPNEQTMLQATVRVPATPGTFTDIRYRVRWFVEGVLVQDRLYGEEQTAAEHEETIVAEYLLRFVGQTYARAEATATCTTASGQVRTSVKTAKTFAFQYGTCPVPDVAATPPNAVLHDTPVTLTADSSYPAEAVTFQWYRGEPGNTQVPAADGEGAALTVTEPGTYWVRAFTECGTHADSGVVAVSREQANGTICTPVRIAADPQDRTSEAYAPITLNVTATSMPSPSSYLWSSSTTSNVGMQQTMTINPGPRKTTDYWVTVGNACSTARSRMARVHVTSCVEMTIHAQPQNDSIVSGQSSVLSINASPAASLQYQWYAGVSGDTSNPVGTGPAITVTPAVTQQYWVRLSFAGGTGCEVDSATATVSVCGTPQLLDTPSDRNSAGPGLDQTFSVNAAGQQLSYAWYEGALDDESKPVLSITPGLRVYPTHTTDYWVKVTSDCAPPQVDRSVKAAFRVSVCPDFEGDETATAASMLVSSGTTTTVSVDVDGADSIAWYAKVGSGDAVKFDEGVGHTTVTTPAITQTTSFYAIARSGNCTRQSGKVTVEVCSTPHIHWGGGSSPQVAKGASFTLEAGVSQNETANFAFYRETAPEVWTLVHSSSNVYPVNSLQTTTRFKVRATDPVTGCHDDSTIRTVSVCIPTIVTQPQSQTINAGTTATLTVSTDLTGMQYQWYRGAAGDTSNPEPGLAGSGQTSTLNVIPSATTTYWVRVTGCTATGLTPTTRDSQAATLTICAIPSISTQPSSIWMTTANTTLTVAAAGTELVYQWYQGPSGNTSAPLGTAASLTVSPSQTTDYWVRVSGRCGTAVNSATAKVSVKPSITAQPVGGPIMSGTTRTLTVTASGTELTYKWYLRTGVTTEISGATSSSYTPPSITADTTYMVRVSSGIAYIDSSDVTFQLCITPNAKWGTGNPAQVAKGASFTLIAGLNAGETANFKWYRGTTVGDVANSTLVSSSSNSYPVSSLQSTTSYWVRAWNEGSVCTSDTPLRTVNVCVPTIVTSPQSIMINPSASTTLTVTTDLTGMQYQWYRGAAGDTSQPLSGHTVSGMTSSLVVTPSATSSYWVRVTGCPSPLTPVSTDSAVATVSICQPPQITVQPQPSTSDKNVNVPITVTATGTGLHYQWYEGAAGDMTTPVGTDSSTYTYATTVSKRFWVRVTGSCSPVANSTDALQSVKPDINTQPAGGSITKGTTRTLTVVASGTDLTYQWYQRANGTVSALSGKTAASFLTPAIDADSTYFCRVTSGTAQRDSNDAVLTVCQPNAFTSNGPADLSGSVVRLTITNPLAGETFQWYRGASGDVSNPAGTAAVNDVSPLATTQYWVRTTRTSCSADSAATTVNVCRPSVTAQPASASIVAGTSVSLSVTATGTGPLVYQWYNGTPGSGTLIQGATSSSYLATPSANTTYSVEVTSGSSCASRTTQVAVPVTVCQPAAVTAQSAASLFSYDDMVTVEVTATGDSLHYQWYEGQVSDTSKPAGTDNRQYTFQAKKTAYYWVRVTSSCGTPVNSTAIWVSVRPRIDVQPANTVACGVLPKDVKFTVTAKATEHYQWYRKFTGQAAQTIGLDQDSLTTSVTTTAVEYYVVLTSGQAPALTSTKATVSNSPAPTVTDLTAQVYQTTKHKLIANVALADYNLVSYKFYQGALGDTSILVADTSSAYTVVTAPYRPITYWVRVSYLSTGCSTDRAVTIP